MLLDQCFERLLCQKDKNDHPRLKIWDEIILPDSFSVLESAVLLFHVLCHVLAPWFKGLQLLHLPRRWSFLWLRINWSGFCRNCFFLLMISWMSCLNDRIYCKYARSEMQAHNFKCSHTLQSAFGIVFLGVFVFVFVFIEKDFLFDMFTFIAWDVGEHLYWM